MDKQFVVLIVAILLASGCSSSSQVSSKSPTQVTESYLNYHFGFGQDTKSAYQLLSNETKQNITYADYDVEMSNLKQYSRGTFSIRSVEIANKTSQRANVSIMLKVETSIGSYNEEGYAILINESGSWRFDGVLSPFNLNQWE